MDPGTPAARDSSPGRLASSPHTTTHANSHATASPLPSANHSRSASAHDADRPSKRLRLDGSATPRSASRAASPPWKSFSAHGPTTVFENGVRKSSRVNREAAAPTPEPPKRNARALNKSAAKHTPKSTPKPTPKAAAKATPKTAHANGTRKALPSSRKAAPPPPTRTPASRKSERQRKPALPSPVVHDFDTPTVNGHDPDGGLYGDPDDDEDNPAPRLRLHLRKLDPPNRHPHHAPPAPKFGSLGEWLDQDDPLEGEESQRITQAQADDEARRRLRIVEAAENGVLSRAQCSIFAPEPAPEPPMQYGHWDHVVAHALHFNKLLREEKAFHRRMAKTLAREACEYWRNKFKRKSQDEIDQEETERQITRYKQLVKDVKDAWGNVRQDIDKERVAKWEEEQLQLGHKAMDDMFNQAQEILGRNVTDTASSFVSEDREFEDEGDHVGDFESGVSEQHNLDDVMSSSEDSESGGEEDEDANLTAEQLRAKYEQLPDFPDSSDEEEDEEEGDEDEEESGQDDSGEEVDNDEEDDINEVHERTPAPTPDSDLDLIDADALPSDSFSHANGWHSDHEAKPDYIDPATVELEQVDDALLDSDDNGSGSGSEAWSSDEDDEDDERAEQGTGDSELGSDEDDGDDDEEEEDDDDVGLMGFLGASDIKKLKEAAKNVVENGDEDENGDRDEQGGEQAVTNGVNGHGHASTPAGDDHDEEDDAVSGKSGGVKTDAHTNGDETPAEPESTVESKPTPEDEEMKDVDDVDEEMTQDIPRSRETSSPPRAEIPPLLRGTLREYQHGGLDWLANLYDTETNGILADEMGLGKTIQTISLLAYIACFRQVWGPHLVVVPTSVMLNWEMEFKKFLPGFKILTYYGDINERKRKRMGWRSTGKDMYNVVITSYQLILQDAAAFKMRAWHYLILDEAHNIKNFKSQRWQTMLTLRTERRLLLTGTPLQNNIDELWSLLYFLMPAGFAGEGRIANLEEFTLALKNPTSQILDQGRQQLDAEAQKIVTRLHEVLRPYLLRRLKAEVEKQMPGKYEHVVYCKLSKRQRQLYDGFMGRASTKEILSSGNYMSIINCLMSLRKVCNHPDLFETRAIVTSMAMPKSVPAQYEIKDLLIRKRLQEDSAETVNLDALNFVFARREQTQLRHARRSQQIRATRPLEDLIERQTRRLKKPTETPASSLQATIAAMGRREQVATRDHLQRCLNLTRARTQFMPIYGREIINAVTVDWHDHTFGARREGVRRLKNKPPPANPYGMPHVNPYGHHPFGQSTTIVQPREEQEYEVVKRYHGELGFRSPKSISAALEWSNEQVTHFYDMIPTLEQRAEALKPLITCFTCVTPAVAADEMAPLTLSKRGVDMIRSSELTRQPDPFHESRIRQSIAFPDKRLLQYDCGKLQRLATLLRDLQAGGHRALIFTQMTKVLDILEQFLNIHGHRYLRLDGSTKVEQRQILTDRFNNDTRILAFILSSRSGGLGINLTGADTVIFYDLDWNPAMDKQCQDRAHRIGQTRDVHIYKFVSEYTIEANILRKSNQKRLLDDVIIQKGDFTTDTFASKVHAAQDVDAAVDAQDEAGAAMERVLGERAGLLGDARVMGAVEDTEDRTAASVAHKEIVDQSNDDHVDFAESAQPTTGGSTTIPGGGDGNGNGNGTSASTPAQHDGAASTPGSRPGGVGGGVQRHVDEYMLRLFRDEFGNEPWRPLTERQKQRRRQRKGKDVHVRTRKRRF
jgi:helicase SWR1